MLLSACGTTSTSEVNNHKLTLDTDSGVQSVLVQKEGVEVKDFTQIEAFTELTAVITLKDGFELEAVTFNNNPIVDTNGTYSFEMPDADATFKVTTTEVTGSVTVENDSEKGTYELTIAGTPSDDNTFKIGDKVQIKVTPNEGYRVDTVKVDGTEVVLTDGAYEFTASKKSHVIAIEYAELYSVSLSVLKEPMPGFYESTKVLVDDKESANGSYYESGAEVKLVLTAANNYNNFQVTSYRNNPAMIYLNVNDAVYHGDDKEVAQVSEDFMTLTFTFTIEDQDLDFKLSFNSSLIYDEDEMETGTKFVFEKNDYVSVYGWSKDDQYDGTFFSPVLERTPGYKITKMTLTNENGDTEDVTTLENDLVFKNNVSQDFSLSTDFTGTVTIRITGEMTTERKVNYVGLENVTATYGDIFDASLIAGDTVSMSDVVSSDPTKRISDIKFEGVETSAEENNSHWSYEFEMPENDVTITFEFEDLLPLTWTGSNNIESVSFSSNSYNSNPITHAEPGAMVYIFITPKEGFLVSKVTDQDGHVLEASGSTSEDYYIGVVGDNGLTITIETDNSYTITADDASSQYVTTMIFPTSAVAGTDISFYYQQESYSKNVKDVYLTDDAGTRLNDVEIRLVSDPYGDYYHFTMPASNVVICYELEDAQGYETTFNITSTDNEDVSKIIQGIFIKNDGSEVDESTYVPGFKATLYEGTNTQVGITVLPGYEVTGSYTYTENGQSKKEEMDAYIYDTSYTFYPFVTPANIQSVDIVISKKKALNVTITHDSSLTDEEFNSLDISYAVNGDQVDTLTGKVFNEDYINLMVNSDAPEGYTYFFKVTDANGEEITGNYSGYHITGSFTITFGKIRTYALEVNDTTSNDFANGSLVLSNKDKINLYEGAIYGEGLTGYIEFSYVEGSVDYTVTVGGKQVLSGTVSASGAKTATFTIDGDVVITLKDHVEA